MGLELEEVGQTRRKTKSWIHFLLVILTTGVALLFIIEFYNTTNNECYIDETRYRIVKGSRKTMTSSEFTISDVLEDKLQPTQSIIPNTPSGSPYPYNDSISKRQNRGQLNDIILRQIARQRQLRTFCLDEAVTLMESKGRARNLLYSEKQGVIYCSVPKVACTNWKRMLQVFEGKLNDPLDIAKKQDVHRMKYSNMNRLSKVEREWRKNLYYSFMFVRHPFERLLSAYRNKFLDPYSGAFQKRYGSKILKLFRGNLTQKQYRQGKSVTFKEFVDFVIYVYDNKGAKYFDEHWQIMHTLCRPCTMKYNYIGKMETLLEDANQVLKEIGLYGKFKFPANATDKYNIKVKTLMKKFYAPLSKKTLEKLYDIYEDDFRSFGYEIPDYLHTGELDTPS